MLTKLTKQPMRLNYLKAFLFLFYLSFSTSFGFTSECLTTPYFCNLHKEKDEVKTSDVHIQSTIYLENGTYKAAPSAVAGNFYEYNGDWFYVAINRADLKSKTDLWNNAAYSNNPNRALLITGLNGTYSIPVNHIVTTRVTDMGGIFSEASNFNQDIGSWDLSHVVNMSFMFNYASSFNQDIGNWDVKHVTDMQWMFNYAPVFNQDIGNWNVSNVINMTAMLHGASSFNQDIGNWDVSSVTNMTSMFNNASLFNQDISDWDVSNVVHMTEMFRSSSSFNQDLSDWDINSATHMEGMFYNSFMSCENYSHTLQGWANNPNIASNVNFSNQIGRSFSPDVITARNYLMNTKGWAISGDTQGACRIACQTPVNLTVDNLTSNSAKLIWESDESSFEIEWGTAGFAQGNGTIVSSITTLFYELDNLQPNT